MEPLVTLLAQGMSLTNHVVSTRDASNVINMTAPLDPALRVLGMLRQAAWLLVHVGVRAAHLYLYSCNQQPGPHIASLQQPLASTKRAYQLVEMGKLADHSKVPVLLDVLRCWAGKVLGPWNDGGTPAPTPQIQPVLVLLLAHPLVLHALQRDVQGCGFAVQVLGGRDDDDDIEAALQAHAAAKPTAPCCVCLPSSVWPLHCPPSVLHGG